MKCRNGEPKNSSRGQGSGKALPKPLRSECGASEAGRRRRAGDLGTEHTDEICAGASSRGAQGSLKVWRECETKHRGSKCRGNLAGSVSFWLCKGVERYALQRETRRERHITALIFALAGGMRRLLV